jgi:hypothetical protein
MVAVLLICIVVELIAAAAVVVIVNQVMIDPIEKYGKKEKEDGKKRGVCNSNKKKKGDESTDHKLCVPFF